MKREEIISEIKSHLNELKNMGVIEIVVSRECTIEDITDSNILIIVRLVKEDYESYNEVQEFLNRYISERIEIIPHDSFEAKLDDHFDKEAIRLKISQEE